MICLRKRVRNVLGKMLRSKGKRSFLSNLKAESRILDIGCGNNAVQTVKSVLPNCHYTGLDVGDYNQSVESKKLIDDYLIVEPQKFTETIADLEGKFDAVISSHNLEHCDDRDGTFKAMLKSIKNGGSVYLSFPCEDSVHFPSRSGTLNYFDDNTHKDAPPNYDDLIDTLKKNGFDIDFATKRYRPALLVLIGLFIEPLSVLRKRAMRGTWELYGFESIIHATRKGV